MEVAYRLVSRLESLSAGSGQRKSGRSPFVILLGAPESMRSGIREGRLAPRIWIVDAEHWPRSLLRAELIERGYDAVGFAAAGDAAAALRSGTPSKPDLLVVELRGQSMRRDLLAALTEPGIPIVVLGGAVELDDPLLSETHWEAVFRRPFTIGAVADEVALLLSQRGGTR
jgi:DNA-binding response OmpR family regulator